MTIFVIQILTFVVNLGFGTFVFLKNRKSIVNQSFSVFATASAFWSLSLFIILATSSFPNSQLLWARLGFSFGALVPTGLLLFSMVFPQPEKAVKFKKVIVSILGMIFFIIPFFSVKTVRVQGNFISGTFSPLYYLWVIYFFSLFFYALYNFIKKYLKSSGLLKIQERYLMIGLLLFLIPAITTNIILPAFGIRQLNSIGPVFSIPMVALIAYAIIRYRLMDIEIIIRTGTIFSFLFGIIAFIFIAGVSFLQPYLPQPLSGLLVAFLITLLFTPLKNFLERITDKVFFRKRYRFEDAVRGLNHILIRSLKLEELLANLLQHLMSVLKIRSAIAVMAESQESFISRFSVGFDHQKVSLDRTSPIIQYLESLEEAVSEKEQRKILDCAELEYDLRKKENIRYEAIVKEFKNLGFSLALPIFSKEELIGIFLLGEKRSRDPFSSQDFKFLEVVLYEVSSAIENALNVERLMRLDESKSEFITVVSHQLRTPLSVARWNFELLLEGAFGKLPAKAKDITHNTYRTLMTLNQGLNNLIAALEIEENKVIMKYENSEINKDIIEEVIADLEREILAKNIAIKRRLSFKGLVTADRQKLRKAIEVILDNAIRYSAAHSTVTISTVWQRRGLRSELLISIEDEGIGIPLENYELIFKRKFFRGEEAKKMSPNGFGLGLFIARKYIELHGGQLWLEKKQRPGSIFYFTIPIKEISKYES